MIDLVADSNADDRRGGWTTRSESSSGSPDTRLLPMRYISVDCCYGTAADPDSHRKINLPAGRAGLNQRCTFDASLPRVAGQYHRPWDEDRAWLEELCPL
jgi:hypothetical protein